MGAGDLRVVETADGHGVFDGDHTEARSHVLADRVDHRAGVGAARTDQRVVAAEHVDSERATGEAAHGERSGEPRRGPSGGWCRVGE